MKVKLMGAARTVTGSCYIIEAAGRRFAVDCGLHQGNEEIEKRNWNTDIYDSSRIEFILVTHAHMDHAGLIPRLVQKGFRGRIYMTPCTGDLLKIMLLDSAHIQETEALWKSKRRLRHGETDIAPLYVQKDAMDAFPLFSTVTYNEPFSPFPGLTVVFRDAGHIIGAAMIELSLTEDGKQIHVVFSGDIGRPSQLIVRDPTIIKEADFLFMESTYGNRNHKDEGDSLNELAEAISYSYKRGQKVIIPAFAVERTQEMIYSLHLLSKDGRLPDIPVFVDSPLAIRATEIFRNCKKYMDEDTKRILENGDDPLQLPGLSYTQTTDESIAINKNEGPAIVISASGMANAGRIKHHLRHNLWREGASIVFVGFQAQGTPGRKIVDGARKVRIFNEDVAVRAKIFTINGFSAHAGQKQLMDWFGHFETRDLKLFLTHGEYAAQQELARAIKERFGAEAAIPEYLEEITLTPGLQPEVITYPEKAEPRIDWAYLLSDLEKRLSEIQNRRAEMEKKDWSEQADLRDRLLDLSRHLAGIISEI